jgi:integrase/recombinase XerD
MFDQLFPKPWALARYRDGPLAEERRRFLVHCAEKQLGTTSLRIIAAYTLVVAKVLRLAERPGELITPEEIKAAADRWARRRSPRRSLPSGHAARRQFIHLGTRWLSYLGRLQRVTPTPQPYAGEVTAFADYMRQECGLSPKTIENNCRTACEFLAQLNNSGLRLDTLTIPQLDDLVARQVREGSYARRTVRTYVYCLRAFFRYAEARGWCRQGFAVALKAPRVYHHESLPSGPSWEDVKRLLAATQGNKPADIRAQAVLLLLAVYPTFRIRVRELYFYSS